MNCPELDSLSTGVRGWRHRCPQKELNIRSEIQRKAQFDAFFSSVPESFEFVVTKGGTAIFGTTKYSLLCKIISFMGAKEAITAAFAAD